MGLVYYLETLKIKAIKWMLQNAMAVDHPINIPAKNITPAVGDWSTRWPGRKQFQYYGEGKKMGNLDCQMSS